MADRRLCTFNERACLSGCGPCTERSYECQAAGAIRASAATQTGRGAQAIGAVPVSARGRRLGDSRSRTCMVVFALPLAGSAEMQSALDPAGPQAARISNLWWLMFAVCTAVFLAVIGVLLYATYRSRPDETEGAGPETERRITAVVTGATAVTVVILFALLTVSVSI